MPAILPLPLPLPPTLLSVPSDYLMACASFLTTTVSPAVLSAVNTVGAALITAVVNGTCIVLVGICANSGCFLRICCTILVCEEVERGLLRGAGKSDHRGVNHSGTCLRY